MRGTLHFLFIDHADRQTMDKELAELIEELTPKPRRIGDHVRVDVTVEGMSTTHTQVCVLVRIEKP